MPTMTPPPAAAVRSACLRCALALLGLLTANARAVGADVAADNAGAEAPAPGNSLLVIAPEGFKPALEEFLKHKASLLSTEWVALESALRDAPGVDDPERLKRYLFNRWQEGGLGYVLLVGDVDVLPVRYMVLDRKTESAFNYSFYPSDLYYSDLADQSGEFEDWNAVQDDFHAGYFGEVRGEHNKNDPINFDGCDYLPDVAVGRWPVSTPEEAAIVAAKSIAYEQQVARGDNPRLRTAAMFAVGGWVDNRGQMESLAQSLQKNWQVERRFFAGRRRAAEEGALQPTRDEARKLLNAGLGLAVHTGHGQPDSWEQCLMPADVAELAPVDVRPVVISAGCSTAHFAPLGPYEAYVDVDGNEHAGTDHGEKFTSPPPPPHAYQPQHDWPCLAEQLLLSPQAGAVAYIGCNTGSQPCGLTLVDGFIAELTAAERPRLGDCWTAAVGHYHRQQRLAELQPDDGWYPPSIFFQAMKFMMFGDPTLAMPTAQ